MSLALSISVYGRAMKTVGEKIINLWHLGNFHIAF